MGRPTFFVLCVFQLEEIYLDFNKTIYSFAYKACLWSNQENLDGKTIIGTKGINGIWTTLEDMPISDLKKRDDGVKHFPRNYI